MEGSRTVAELLNDAVAFHVAGEFTEAIQRYQQVLARDPGQFDALHLLATLHLQVGDGRVAADLFDKVIRIDASNPDILNNRAVALQIVGRLEEARESCAQALRINARHPSAYNNLGNILRDLARLEEARANYMSAIRVKPDFADAHVNLAAVLNQMGEWKEALESSSQAIAISPNLARAHLVRGSALHGLARYGEAISSFEEAARLGPDDPQPWANRGHLLVFLSRVEEALSCYEQALRLAPDDAQLHCAHGDALQQIKRYNEALSSYAQALTLKADYAQAHAGRGAALQGLGRLNEALVSYARASQIEPEAPNLSFRLGGVLHELGRLDEALACYDEAIRIKPHFAEAFSDRGVVLSQQRKLADALTSYAEAIRLNPRHAEAYNNQALALKAVGRFDDALASVVEANRIRPGFAEALYNQALLWIELRDYEKARESLVATLNANPNYPLAPGMLQHVRMHLCDWHGFDDAVTHIEMALRQGSPASPPFALLGLTDDPQLQRLASQAYCQKLYPQRPQVMAASRTKVANARPRIAYFSCDFRNHPLMHCMLDVFAHHDALRYDVLAFSLGPNTNDEWRHRAEGSFKKFIDVCDLSDVEIARKAQELGIDIAIDLTGHTSQSRSAIFANRAAPIQVSYVGYPGTMGAEFIDYLIADQVVAPQSEQSGYCENILYLPHCYLPSMKVREISPKNVSRQNFGLPVRGAVYCAFNNVFKITPSMFEAWMSVLNRVDKSVLWVFVTDPKAYENLKAAAERHGVASGRIIAAGFAPADEHLKRLALADIFLDAFPCNAHTTASEALRMGVPIVTLQGRALASRVASSFLTDVGLTDLIATNVRDYIEIACELGADPSRLADVKARLVQGVGQSRIFDPVSYARELERLYDEVLGQRTAP